jgi:hypothetical protein
MQQIWSPSIAADLVTNGVGLECRMQQIWSPINLQQIWSPFKLAGALSFKM